MASIIYITYINQNKNTGAQRKADMNSIKKRPIDNIAIIAKSNIFQGIEAIV